MFYAKINLNVSNIEEEKKNSSGRHLLRFVLTFSGVVLMGMLKVFNLVNNERCFCFFQIRNDLRMKYLHCFYLGFYNSLFFILFFHYYEQSKCQISVKKVWRI